MHAILNFAFIFLGCIKLSNVTALWSGEDHQQDPEVFISHTCLNLLTDLMTDKWQTANQITALDPICQTGLSATYKLNLFIYSQH